MTVVLSICGLILETMALSQIQWESWGDYYNSVRLALWLGVAGLSIRDFLGRQGSKTLTLGLEKKRQALQAQLDSIEPLLEEKEDIIQSQKAAIQASKDKTVLLEQQIQKLSQELLIKQSHNQKLTQDLEKLRNNDANAAATMLLSTLQNKGRFLDFVMSEISSFPDEKVGAAARVVHQGCQEVMKLYFDIKPVREDKEGSVITLEDNLNSKHFKVIGQSSAPLPSSARLIHRGWQTAKVELPQYSHEAGTNKNILAPAEIRI